MPKKTFKEYKPLTIEDTFPTSSIQNIISEIYSDKDKTISENLFLFYGESGSGKTLASRIIAADIFQLEGEERSAFINRLELNDTLSMHFETVNGASHNKVDDARIFDEKLTDIENSMGLSNLPYVFMMDEVDTFTPEAMKTYLTALDRIKDGRIPNVYVFMTTSRVKKLTDEFLRRFLVVEFTPFKRFEQTDRFITYQLEKNKISPKVIDEQTRRDIHFASRGSPGFIANYIKHYLLSGTLPEDPEKDYASASDILKTVLKISVEMNQGRIQSVPKLKRLLDSLHSKTGNWEAVRIAILAAVYYTLDEHSEQGKLTTSGFNILNEYLKILVPFTNENKLGKYELLSRCMSMAQVRYQIIFAEKPAKESTVKTSTKKKEE